MQIYVKAIADLLPTPSKSHYIFNLRDFARVMRGVLLVPAERMTEPDKLIRLWIHEVYRVFNDRLTDDSDRCDIVSLFRSSFACLIFIMYFTLRLLCAVMLRNFVLFCYK